MGIWEFLIIVAIIVLIFGGKKLPEMGRALGKGVKSFKNAFKQKDIIDITPSNNQLREEEKKE